MDSLVFVQTIEAELKARGIKKAEFYKATGISSATFSQWRKRKYSPSATNIKQVEDYLGITVEVRQKENPTVEDGEVEKDPLIEEALRLLANMTQAEQQLAIERLDNILKSR